MPRLEFQTISKNFFGVPVVREVSFSLEPGRVLALVGENGAGKSTLMNILGGVLPADRGSILLDGRPHAPRSPAEASWAGVAFVHQELNLFTNLSIGENVFLADFPRRFGLPWVDRGRLRAQTRSLLESLGIALDPDRGVEELSPGERQLVEIAKGLHTAARVVVFDEPTTSLTEPESERLFEIIQRLRGDGISVIYISHNLGDVLRICDDVVVLRDGQVQAAGPKSQFTLDRMIALMVGRTLEQLFPPRSTVPSDARVLAVRGLSQPGVIDNVSFELRRGELLGVAGLMGSGRTELARILFGLDGCRHGEILLDGRPLRPSPKECIRHGMAFLTENRREEGLLMEAAVEENLVLASLREFTRAPGYLDRKRLRNSAKETAQAVAIDCPAIDRRAAKTLSGGNQQKVVLGKWLLTRPKVLILDEPTRGIDVGAKFEIYRLINDLLARGTAVLMISSEIEELLGMCDRVLVMSAGAVQGCVDRANFDRQAILRSAIGENRLR